MNNWIKSPAKPESAVSIMGFVVLLGIKFNLAWAGSVTAGNGTDLDGNGTTDLLWRNIRTGSTAI